MLHEVLLFAVGKTHKHYRKHASSHEQDECPVPTGIFSHIADNYVGEHGSTEHIAHKTGQTGGGACHILRCEVERLHANEHHRTIDEEAYGNEATYHNVQVGDILPVDENHSYDQSHENDGGQSATAFEH